MKYYPLVSVIILVYQNQDYLKKAIDSVLCQDYPELELFVSDDASICIDPNEIQKYIESNKSNNLKRFEVLMMPKNLGTVKHANFIASKTTGKYIRFLGADDEFHDSNVISDTVTFMERTSAMVSTSLVTVTDPISGKKIRDFPSLRKIRWINSLPPKKVFRKLVLYGNIIGGPGTTFRQSFFSEKGGFNEIYKFSEDYPTWLKLIREGEQIPCMPRITVKYRANGISSLINHKTTLSRALFTELGEVYSNEIIPYKNLLSNFEYRYSDFLINRISNFHQYSPLRKILFVFSNFDIILWRRYNYLLEKFEYKGKNDEK